MIQWIDTALSPLETWPVGVLACSSAVSLLFGLIGVWSLWRTRRLLAALPLSDERLDTLSNSLSLLSDTTEACFKALAVQVQSLQSSGGRTASLAARRADPSPPPADAHARKARQRRVVGAADRGDALSTIAASEDLAETEVALRLHLSRESQRAAGVKRYGSVLS